ncbi:hypothetical protein KKH3_22750 [Pectobacterium actinidiae]|nr:hypothetical protein KKH3_22750 [Pectobacterium actinidiae]
MILITIIIIFALQQWLLAGPEGEHDIAHIASSIILASQRAGFFFMPNIPVTALCVSPSVAHKC